MTQNLFIHEPARDVRVSGDADVIVCGGGPAGVAAAVAAGRLGVSVIMLEASSMPGGIMTSGMMPNIIDSQNKKGFVDELKAYCRSEHAEGRYNCFDPEYVKHFLERELVKAQVRIRYGTLVTATVQEGDRLSAIICESPSGREAFTGRIFIDCTGNGTLAALAGCRFEIGDSENGIPQAASLCALCGCADEEDFPQFLIRQNDTGKHEIRKALVECGCTPSYSMPTLFKVRNREYLLMSNHEENVRCDDADRISEALIHGRTEVFRQVETLRKFLEEARNLYLMTTASALGFREGRRIRARYNLSVKDLMEGTHHEDAVCEVRFGVDIHRAVGHGYDNAGISVKPFDVPLRSLMSEQYANLLLAGRCIGGDYYAHAAYRVLGNAIPIGEGAGIAAAAALRNGKELPELSVEEFHQAGGNPHRNQ